MNGYIVVEGKEDEILLSRLIPKDLMDKTTIVTSNGKSAAVSLCRSILSQRQAPTVIVVDSDTTDEAEIREQKLILEDLFRPVAGNTPYLVQFAIPEIETIFFSDMDNLEKVIGVKLSDTDIITARYRPKEVLFRLMKEGGISNEMQLLSRLDKKVVDRLLKHSLLTNIIEFLRESLEQESKIIQRFANHAGHMQ